MDYASFGARIRKERLLRGLTQEQLAEKASISLSFLGHIERGTRKASLETLVSLSNTLHVSLDDLLSDSLNRMVKYQFPSNLTSKKQTALQEILRSVENALATWLEEEGR